VKQILCGALGWLTLLLVAALVTAAKLVDYLYESFDSVLVDVGDAGMRVVLWSADRAGPCFPLSDETRAEIIEALNAPKR
jgi:hypothetical protein